MHGGSFRNDRGSKTISIRTKYFTNGETEAISGICTVRDLNEGADAAVTNDAKAIAGETLYVL